MIPKSSTSRLWLTKTWHLLALAMFQEHWLETSSKRCQDLSNLLTHPKKTTLNTVEVVIVNKANAVGREAGTTWQPRTESEESDWVQKAQSTVSKIYYRQTSNTHSLFSTPRLFSALHHHVNKEHWSVLLWYIKIGSSPNQLLCLCLLHSSSTRKRPVHYVVSDWLAWVAKHGCHIWNYGSH